MPLAMFNPCQPCCEEDTVCPCSGFPNPVKFYISKHLMPGSGLVDGLMEYNVIDNSWSGSGIMDLPGCNGSVVSLHVTCDDPFYSLSVENCFNYSEIGRHVPCNLNCNTNIYINTITSSGCCGVSTPLDIIIKAPDYQFCTSALFGGASLSYSSNCTGLTQDIPDTLYFTVINDMTSSIELTYNSSTESWQGHGIINSILGSREMDVEAWWLPNLTSQTTLGAKTNMQVKITPNPASFTCLKYIDTAYVDTCSPFSAIGSSFNGCGIVMTWILTE